MDREKIENNRETIEKNRTWDPSDMAGLQELIKAKKELEDLGRKRQQLHISFN